CAMCGARARVVAARAIECTGGQILGRLWPRSDEERTAALEAGYDLDEVLDKDRLGSGDDVFFRATGVKGGQVSGNDVFCAATGVTDGELLDGVTYIGNQAARTESVSMRSRSGTVRRI